MIEDPEITTLRTELEQLGVVVAPHRDHLCVRLPLFAAVRVRLEQGKLRCDPIHGPLPRTGELLLTMSVLIALVGGLFYASGPTPAALTVAFGGVMVAAAQTCRFVLTESCITRVQLLWASRASKGRSPTGSHTSTSPTSPQALRAVEVPAADVGLPHLAPTERRR
jgi:hypothetical protein